MIKFSTYIRRFYWLVGFLSITGLSRYDNLNNNGNILSYNITMIVIVFLKMMCSSYPCRISLHKLSLYLPIHITYLIIFPSTYVYTHQSVYVAIYSSVVQCIKGIRILFNGVNYQTSSLKCLNSPLHWVCACVTLKFLTQAPNPCTLPSLHNSSFQWILSSHQRIDKNTFNANATA